MAMAAWLELHCCGYVAVATLLWLHVQPRTPCRDSAPLPCNHTSSDVFEVITHRRDRYPSHTTHLSTEHRHAMAVRTMIKPSLPCSALGLYCLRQAQRQCTPFSSPPCHAALWVCTVSDKHKGSAHPSQASSVMQRFEFVLSPTSTKAVHTILKPSLSCSALSLYCLRQAQRQCTPFSSAACHAAL